MRPHRLEDFYGQTHLLAPDKPLRQADRIWRTALDDLLGSARYRQDHACAPDRRRYLGALHRHLRRVRWRQEIRAAVDEAKQARAGGKPTVLLWTKSIALTRRSRTDLPYVEDGTLTFIGATTENPSFEPSTMHCCRVPAYTCSRR